ncbi:uncharacterized protein LOC106136934 [Amyelois transitella]|uniref:uncharacterized protein LOC106136934 n=1 Tax=Amyelois transitella TaxID=680683 RepID=UPI00067B736E|nr:uncharacterized protein LOC106136934 [Amyelois transitella]
MIFIITLALYLASEVVSVKDNSVTSHSLHELILCRLCGSELSSSNYIINSKISLDSENTFNETLFGKEVFVQVLSANFMSNIPIITFGHSECLPIEEWSEIESWFPDYLWKVCICPACGEIIGWVFQPTNQLKNGTSNIFFALDLHSLIGETFLDSLIKNPYN